MFFQKNKLSDVWSEVHLVERNIVSTAQSVRALKKLYLGLQNIYHRIWYDGM